MISQETRKPSVLKVTLNQPNLRALTRNGYYGEFEDSTGRRPGR